MSFAPLLSSLEAPPGFPPVSSLSSSSLSSTVGDFADFQARVLGLSAEYQALGRWFVASGGSDFLSYLLLTVLTILASILIFVLTLLLDLIAFWLLFLPLLRSPPPPSSVGPTVSSLSLPTQAPVAPVPFSSSLDPSAPPPRFPAPSLASLFSSVPSSIPLVLRAPPVSSSFSLSLPSWQAVLGGSGVALGLGAVPVSLPVPPPV